MTSNQKWLYKTSAVEINRYKIAYSTVVSFSGANISKGGRYLATGMSEWNRLVIISGHK